MALYRDPYERLRALAAGEDPDATPSQPLLTPEEEARQQRALAAQQQSESTKAFRQGVENVKASGYGARGLARLLITDNEEGGLSDLRRAQQIQSDAGEFGPRVQSVEDVDGVGSALEYARNIGLQQVPNIALAAGTGLVGGLARAGVGTLARGAGEKALAQAGAQQVERLAARRAFEQGASLGGAAAGSVLQAGMAPGIVLDEDPNNEASIRERAAAAAVGSVATGALEALPVAALFRRYGLTGAEEAVKGGVLSRLTQQAAKQGTTEALTEVAQQAGERVAHRYVNDNVELLGPEAYSEYINAAAGGFVGGGLFGAPAGLRGAKSDSAAGKRYADSFKDYMGRFKRKPTPDGGAGQPARVPPGTRIDEGEPVNIPEFARRASETIRTVADTVKGKVPDLASKGKDILDQVQARTKDFLGETDTNNSVTELLDALPFEGQDSDIGTRTFNGGAGIGPAMDLIPEGVRPARIAAEFDVPLKTAIVGSMIEDPGLRASLFDSGAMDEAAKVLEGADPATLDNDKINAFQDALGPEGSPRRNAFNRVGATFWNMQKDDVQPTVPPRAARNTETTRNQRAAGVVDEQAPLRDTKKVVSAWKREAGKPLPERAPAPANSIILRNKKGERLAMPGNQLGVLIQQARAEDPTYGEGGTALQVAKVLADFVENGYQIDTASIKPLRLANGWHLTPEGVRQLTSPAATLAQDASQNPPGLAGRARQTALTEAYGKKDQPAQANADEGGEMASMLGEPPGPRKRSPLGTRVTTDEKTDPRVRRASKAIVATDKARSDLDGLLKGIYGPDTAIENEDQRRELFSRAWKKHGGIKADNLQSSAGTRDVGDMLGTRLRDAAAAYKEAKDVERRALRPKKGEQTKARAPEDVTARVAEGETLDAAPVSTTQAKIERDAEKTPELDDILAERFGTRPDSFEQRRAQFKTLKAELTAQTKGANQRVPRQALARLNEAAEAFGERSRVQAVNRLNKARKAYFAEWNKLSQAEKVEVADAVGLEDANATALANKLKYTKTAARKATYEKVADAAPRGVRVMSTLREFTDANGAYYAAGLTEEATGAENAARARNANPLVNPPQSPAPGPERGPSAAERAAAKKDVAARAQPLLEETDVNFSPSENPLFVEFDRLRAAAAVRYKAAVARMEALEQEEMAKLRAKHGTRFDDKDGQWQLRDMAHQNLTEDSDEYSALGRELQDYTTSPKGPIRDFYEFRRANEDALRRHPTIRRLYERGLQRRLDVNKDTLSTIERMAIEFELAALRGGFTEAWRADQLAQKSRRVEKYKAEDNYKSNRRLQAVVAQIEKEIGLIRRGDAQAVIGMNARESDGDIVPTLPGESDVNHDATSSAQGVAAEIKSVLATRSKRALHALKNKVANSNFSDSVRSKLLMTIDEALADVRAATNSAGRADIQRNSRRTATADRFNKVFKELRRHDSLEAALAGVRESASPDQKRLIDTLIGMRALRGVKFSANELWTIDPGLVAGVHEAPVATGSSINSTVTINFPSRPTLEGRAVDPIAVLLHEALHAATVWSEQNNPQLQRAFSQMLDHARSEALKLGVDPDVFYGLSETQEFVAEAFTNPELQNLLRQMPARNTDKFASLWDEFKDFVRTLLGFASNDANLLDEVFAVGLDAARETAAARENIFNEIFGGDVNFSPTAIINTPASGSQSVDYIPLLSPDNRRFLEGAFRRGDVRRQIEAALPANRRDLLNSADKGPQLLINAGIALAMQGKLNLKNDTKTFSGAVNELWDVLSRVLQLPSKTVYARKVLSDIATQGAVRGAKSDVKAQTLNPVALAITRKVDSTIGPVVQSFARDMDQRMRKTGVPALTQLATLISQRTGENRADRTQSYSARKLVERNKRMNAYFQLVGSWSDERKAAVTRALQTQGVGGHVTIKGALQDITKDVEAVRGFYADMRDYLVAAGVLGKDQALDDYFPVSIDPANVAKNKQDFIDLFSAPNIAKGARARDLEILKRQRKHAKDNGASAKHLAWFDKRAGEIRGMTDAELAESWYSFASGKQGATHVGDLTFADGEHTPGFKYENQRLMDFVYKLGTADQKEVFAKFQDQNIDRVTVRYIDRATRRGEWERMGLTSRVKSLMDKAQDQGANPKQLQMAQDYVDQVMGSYGTDWHPWIKKITDNFGITLPPFEKFQALQSSLITYQNLRLLPLALMSSLIDPLGVSVREGATTRVFGAYRDAVRAFRNKNGNDALRALAEDMGIIERHAVSEALIYMYGGASDPSGVNARLNAALFKYNGLEYVTKFSRLAALSAGQRFLIAHKDGSNVDSKRYLRELNLTPADVQIDAAGNLVRSTKIDAALSRFVDESVVRPTPTQRPSWHNDPHFALAAQYKGYLYSFWNTVSRRIGVELNNGNVSVLLPVMMYLPVTALGEMMRDMAQGDDEDRDAAAYAALAVERSGLLGPHINLLTSAQQDVSYGNSVLNSIAGPTGQQLSQAYDASSGQRSAGNTFVEALPASALFEDWFR